MNKTIDKILGCIESETIRKFKPRTPSPNETPEETADADFCHEIDFFSAESFKLGFLLGMEISNN